MPDDRGPWLHTHSGLKIHPLDYKLGEMPVKDIAHHLSHLCRYVGATNWLYTVGQHCILMSLVAPEGWELEALHHEDAESLMGDFPGPLKAAFPEVQAAENKLQASFNAQFRLRPMSAELKVLDRRIRLNERNDLKCKTPAPWKEDLDGLEPIIWDNIPFMSRQKGLDWRSWNRRVLFDPAHIGEYTIPRTEPFAIKARWLERHYELIRRRG